MSWADVIQSLIGFVLGGGLGTLITNLIMAKYKRQAAALENEAQSIRNHTAELDRWKDLHERALQSADKIEEKYKAMLDRKDERLLARDKEIADLKSELARKDDKIDSLYTLHSKDREEADRLSSENTALTILRCDVIGCALRKPPLVYQVPQLKIGGENNG